MDAPFLLQSVVDELYLSQDLLDLSAPGESHVYTPSSPAGSLFGTASHIASVAARRATGAAGSPTRSSPVRPDGPAERARGLEAASASGKEIRCVEGYGPNLYIGFSDGTVEWWVCDGGAGTSKAQGWTMRHKHTLFPRRPVSSIVIVPKVAKMLIISDGTMHSLALPSLEVIPSAVIQPLRGVSSVILDDNEMEWAGPGGDERNAEVIVVVVRRRGLAVYRLGERMQLVKEIPLPTAPTSHALTHTYLCAAMPSSGTYSLIDLSDASLTEVLPISQVDAESLDWDPAPNVAVIPGADEFLVTSYTGVGTMGVFLNGQGDPVRGTMEWEEHPTSIAIDSGYIIALLRNNTIVIHALNELDRPVQTIQLDPKLQPFTLSYSPYGISIRDAVRDARLGVSPFRLLHDAQDSIKPKTQETTTIEGEEGEEVMMFGSLEDATTDAAPEEPMGGSGLTPPSSPPQFPRQPITPKRQASLLQSTAPPTLDGPFSTCVAETLIIGPNGIMSLAPIPTITKVEQLCKARNMDSAIAMVDEERRKGRRGEVDADKATHQGTLRFLHLYLALQLFANGLFERAGEYLTRGKIDPRLIVRSYTALRGKLLGSEEEVDIFDGLRDVLHEMPAVDAIVDATVKRNFVPQAENDDDADESKKDSPADQAAEAIRGALSETANAMLEEFLTKTRHSRRKGGGSRGVDSRKIETVIDTVLVKLLATSGSTSDLLALLAAPNDCVLSEVEPFLQSKPYILATVLRKQGRHDRVLELLKQLAESDTVDPLCPDPIAEIAQELDHVRDADTIRQYALWMIGRDVDRGVSLLIAQSAAKVDHEALVRDIRAVSEDGANRYLEHIVVGLKSPNRTLHRDLLDRLLTRLEKELSDEGIRYHLEELDAEYRLLADPEPYCVFIADFAPKTPVKEVRLKTMLFLQGSPFYNLQETEARLAGSSLKYERAIVLGKLGRNHQALELLARDVSDSVSAQTFCTQDGEVIPPRVANRVAQCVPELAAWAALCEMGRGPRDAEKVVDAATQQGLVMELLGVYMRHGASTSKETAALLNAQSRHLDTLKVLDMVPPSWPVDVISSFTQRALRRQLHDRCSVAILKGIAAGQNLQVAEEYLDAIRSLPPVWQEADPNALSVGDTAGEVDEKSPGLSEKSVATYTTTTSSGDAEKTFNGDEGSVPDNVDDAVGPGGKEGFFSPEIVDKELRRVERRLGRARSRGDDSS